MSFLFKKQNFEFNKWMLTWFCFFRQVRHLCLFSFWTLTFKLDLKDLHWGTSLGFCPPALKLRCSPRSIQRTLERLLVHVSLPCCYLYLWMDTQRLFKCWLTAAGDKRTDWLWQPFVYTHTHTHKDRHWWGCMWLWLTNNIHYIMTPPSLIFILSNCFLSRIYISVTKANGDPGDPSAASR